MSRERLIVLLATGGGLGYAPVASGTFGTLGAFPLLPLLVFAGPVGGALVVLAVTVLAVRVADEAERVFGEKDSGRIVIDEIAGFLVTLWWVPLTAGTLLAGFVLFRAFDVLKPWPGRTFDRRGRGGFGVVMDDVVAGLYAQLVLRGMLGLGWIPF